jgi:hypothetical protein
MGAVDRSIVADVSGATPELASGWNLLPNNLPETPMCSTESVDKSTAADAFPAKEVLAAEEVANLYSPAAEAQAARINCHGAARAFWTVSGPNDCKPA